MDNKRLPICSLINEIKSNNYYRQSKVKSRIPQTTQYETEMEGSIATENIVTQYDIQDQQKTSGTGIHYAHKRKQSANIPYKMAIAHTNISKMANCNNYGYVLEQPSLQSLNNNDMQDDDEEWNVGGDAEETIIHNAFQIHQQASSSRYTHWLEPSLNRIGLSKESYQRSSTTKSGCSSAGHALHGFSTEDDDDNFWTLEWDENLYEDERTLQDFEDQDDRSYSVPIKNKQSKVDAQIRNHLSKEK